MNKLGFYVEVTAGIPGLADAIREVRPPTLLTHANDRGLLQAIRRDLSPDTFVIGRLHQDVHQQNEWLAGDEERAGRGEWLAPDDARQSGRAFAEQILAHDFSMAKERYPNEPGGRLLIDAWMSLNECLPGPASEDWQKGTAEDRKKLKARAMAFDWFQVGFRERLLEEGLEAVAFNFGAGNFQTAAHYLEWFPQTLASYTYLGFHEYGWPTLYPDQSRQSESAAGLYRTCMAGFQAAHPNRDYRVIITEAGMARMYHHAKKEAGDVGWQFDGETLSQEDYWESLQWYNEQLDQDDYVVGACLFNVGPNWKWVTFRHLGADNQGNPIGILGRLRGLGEPKALVRGLAPGWISLEGRVTDGSRPIRHAEVRLLGSPHTLGADPQAAVYDPSAVVWTRAITGFEGSAWNCWRRFVAHQVAGITWQEFKVQVPQYNPSLAESGGRFRAEQTYLLPASGPSYEGAGNRPQVLWDRQVSGFSGSRRACWLEYVRGKVVGLSWEQFRQDIRAHNPHLAEDGNTLLASRTYLLPRNADQYHYTRVVYTSARGHYRFRELLPGRYDVQVRADGYRLLETAVDVAAGRHVLDLELEAIPVVTIRALGPWVSVRDRQFMVNGTPFRFVGVNIRGLVHYGTGTFRSADEQDRCLQLDEAKRMGARVVRVFLAACDASKEEIGNRFEKALGIIEHDYPDMYLLPAFTNLYSDTPFKLQGDDPFYKTQPDGWTLLCAEWYLEGYKKNYLPFVDYMVDRFRDNPYIFAWEIGNELKATGKPRDFVNFNLAVTSRIRSLDPQHLITTGMLSTCHAGIFPPGKRMIYGPGGVDFVTNHLYDYGRRQDPNDVCLNYEDSALAEELKKPWLVEEAGFQASPDQDRSQLIREDMKRWFDRKAGGYMQWAFMAGGKDNGDGDHRHGMDRKDAWHRDWDNMFSTYRQAAEALRKLQPL